MYQLVGKIRFPSLCAWLLRFVKVTYRQVSLMKVRAKLCWKNGRWDWEHHGGEGFWRENVVLRLQAVEKTVCADVSGMYSTPTPQWNLKSMSGQARSAGLGDNDDCKDSAIQQSSDSDFGGFWGFISIASGQDSLFSCAVLLLFFFSFTVSFFLLLPLRHTTPHSASATFEFFFLSFRGELAPKPL